MGRTLLMGFDTTWKVICTVEIRAATFLLLLLNETIQSNTRGKKSEPGIRKQLNIDVKSTRKLNFSLNA